MKERPILFSAPMVRALLDDSKTQTRRVAIKTSQPDSVVLSDYDVSEFKIEIENTHSGTRTWKQCPYGVPGDRLWVRETWWYDEEDNSIIYRADPDSDIVDVNKHETGCPKYNWRPSIFMPRAASRITLEIVSIRVERLQDISEADAFAEGVYDGTACRCAQPLDFVRSCGNCGGRMVDAVDLYRSLWESINGPSSWGANPWVWVIEFKRLPS